MNPVRPVHVAIALGLGFLVAESPFTPDDTGPSLAIGAGSALLYLWYRSTHPERTIPLAAADVAQRLRAVPIAVWLCVLLWLGVFAQGLAWMYERWTTSFWHNNHSLIIAVLMGLLALAALRRQADAPYDTSLLGLPLVALGAMLAVLDSGTKNQQLAAAGFVLSLPGMVWLLLGRTRLRALALPLAISVFLVPLPSFIANHLYLRTLTAEWTLATLQAFGMRASLHYSQIELPRQVFEVSEACSGFSTLVAALALGLVLAALCDSTRRRAAILLAILPLTLLANTLRVVVLVLISLSVGTEVLDTMIHEASGVATFVVVLWTLFLLAGRPSVAEAFRP